MVAQHLAKLPLFQQSHHIACYCAYEDEMDTQPIIRTIWDTNKICYLPVLTEEKTLDFVHYDEGDLLLPNQFSILEPDNTARKIATAKLDLVISPLIAFDPYCVPLAMRTMPAVAVAAPTSLKPVRFPCTADVILPSASITKLGEV